jgi:amino acid transporter
MAAIVRAGRLLILLLRVPAMHATKSSHLEVGGMADAVLREEGQAGEKGLKSGALGMLSGVVIGVASTAPGYSLAASLGLVVAAVGLQAPAIMFLAFLPMLFIAAAYYYLNRADPDCGTTFAWVTRAMGPHAGWMGGWGIIVADIIVMANLAQIASKYTFLLFGGEGLAESLFWVTLVGCLFIAVLTWVCYVGIEASARTQYFLLGAEIVTLVIFAAVALGRVWFGDVEGSVAPSLNWLNPFAIDDLSGLTAGILVAVFIYWGWDSTVTVNEETQDSSRTPGVAAILSTIILVGIYVVVSFAAQAFAGSETLVENSDDVLATLGTDVLGSPLDKLLIIAVLTSAAASTQTTILPTARTSLSMAFKGAAPRRFGNIHPRYLTPSTSTIWMGVLSIVWYAALTVVSEDILFDSIAALGLMIAFYYGITGFACPIYYRRELFKSARNAIMVGLAPLLGGLILAWVFIKSCIDLADPENSESGDSWFGLGPPLVIGLGFLLFGVVLMFLQQRANPEFFRRRPEVVGPDGSAISAPTIAPDEQGGTSDGR